MQKITIIVIFFITLSTTINAQVKKIDTIAALGGVSYHVTCNNKSETENSVTVSPKGLGKDINDFAVNVKGRLRKIIVDDVNGDGYPDLIFCVYGGANGDMGNIAAVTTSGNNSITPAYFPDIYSNPKISQGYKGHDEFTTMMGTLTQSFPIYLAADTDTPTGGTRVVQYNIERGEKGSLNFKVLRSYEKK